jgi:flagellar hook protein FlgE
MSLSSALSSAVSGLNAQSTALSLISRNIANASTTAYKTSDASFETLLGSSSDGSSIGGVKTNTLVAMSTQGQISSTSVATNIAIDGAGYFVVSSSSQGSSSDHAFTRDGSFAKNADGYLVNDAGYYLEGFPTDSEGNILSANTSSLTSLEPINLAGIGGTAKATTSLAMSANLPADAAVGDTFVTSATIVDSLGVSHSIDQTWAKTGDNAWTVTLSDPTRTSDPSASSGTISPSSVDVTFDANGVLASTSPSPVALAITGYTTGAADSSITLDLGTPGKSDGLTQLASTSGTPVIGNPSFTQDGALVGQLTAIKISDDGLVTATFDNGVSTPIYRIPIATFTNENGLISLGGSTYTTSTAAGAMSLASPGEGASGAIQASALEGSATDIATEFNKMIVAQQAYSAASQIVTTVKSMFDTLTSAVR